MKYTILSNNPQLYNEIFSQQIDEEQVEWITPRTMEEAQELERKLKSLNYG